MARPRVEPHRLRELIRLWRLGTSARQIVRLLRLSPKTERRYRAVLAAAGLLLGSPKLLPTLDEIRVAVLSAFPPPVRTASSVEPWRERVEQLLAKGLSPRAIFDRLRLEPLDLARPFRGSCSAVRRFARRLRAERGVAPEEVAIPIATFAGLEAQVDFGYAGRLYDPTTGTLRRAWVFVMVLCHSRHLFAKLVFDQKTETWLQLHEEAFRFFGGVVGTVVPDNTRRAVVRAAFGVDAATELERSYREFAQRWGFRIDPAPPGDPRKRGKAEAAVKYLRNGPLKGRDGEDVMQAQVALNRWNREVASVRIHGTTGRRPLEAFVTEEQAALQPLPADPGAPAIWKRAKVHPDAHITCRRRLFSVPWQLVHEPVWVRARGAQVQVFHTDRLVAAHTDAGLLRTTIAEHLPHDRGLLRNRGREFWEERAERVGPDTLALARAVFDQDDVLSHLRQVQAIVKHLSQFPQVRAEAASRRALAAGDLSYRGIKAALAKGLDIEPRPMMVAKGRPEPCQTCGRSANAQCTWRPRRPLEHGPVEVVRAPHFLLASRVKARHESKINHLPHPSK